MTWIESVMINTLFDVLTPLDVQNTSSGSDLLPSQINTSSASGIAPLYGVRTLFCGTNFAARYRYHRMLPARVDIGQPVSNS